MTYHITTKPLEYFPAEGMAFHGQYATLIISQQQTRLPELFQQRFDLVVLKLDDLLLAFIGPANARTP